MIRRKAITWLVWGFMLLSGLSDLAPQSSVPLTTLTGTIRDTTGAPVTSGRIAFTTSLSGTQDATIPGVGRFIPATTYCSINSNGTVFNATQTAPCQITSNLALSPSGTSYTVCVQAYNVSPGGCFNFFALAGQTIDISTIAPTPSTLPTNYTGIPGPTSTVTTNGVNGSWYVVGPHQGVGTTGRANYPTDSGSSQDPSVYVSNTLTDSNATSGGYAHGYADQSIFTRTLNCSPTAPAQFPFPGSPCAYASYDTRSQITGSSNFEHFLGYQSLMGTTPTFSGTLNRGIGFFGHFALQSGTVNNWIGAYFDDSSVSTGATLKNQYGVYIDKLAAGSQSNYAIYVRNNRSFFGGALDQHDPAADGSSSTPTSFVTLFEQHADASDANTRAVLATAGKNFAGLNVIHPASVYFGAGASMSQGLVLSTEYLGGGTAGSPGVGAPIRFAQRAFYIGQFGANGGLCLGGNCTDDHGYGTLAPFHYYGATTGGSTTYAPTVASGPCTVTGDDFAMTVVFNPGTAASSTACVINFALPWDAAPRVSDLGPTDATSAAFRGNIWHNTTTTQLTLSTATAFAANTSYTYDLLIGR